MATERFFIYVHKQRWVSFWEHMILMRKLRMDVCLYCHTTDSKYLWWHWIIFFCIFAGEPIEIDDPEDSVRVLCNNKECSVGNWMHAVSKSRCQTFWPFCFSIFMSCRHASRRLKIRRWHRCDKTIKLVHGPTSNVNRTFGPKKGYDLCYRYVVGSKSTVTGSF